MSGDYEKYLGLPTMVGKSKYITFRRSKRESEIKLITKRTTSSPKQVRRSLSK